MNAQKWVLGNSQSAGPPVLPTRIHCDTHLKTHRHFNSHCCVGTNPHMHTKPHTFSQINTQSGISYTHIHMHSHTDKQLPRHTFSPSLPLSLSPSLPLSQQTWPHQGRSYMSLSLDDAVHPEGSPGSCWGWTLAPGFPVLHHFPEFVQTHVHWVGDPIQPSHSLYPFLLLPSVFPGIRVFSNELALPIRWPEYRSFSISPSSEYSGLKYFRNWLVWSLCCPWGSQKSSPTPQFECTNSLALGLLYGTTLTSKHDYMQQ